MPAQKLSTSEHKSCVLDTYVSDAVSIDVNTPGCPHTRPTGKDVTTGGNTPAISDFECEL